jgi:integrase
VRLQAERTLFRLGNDGRADYTRDDRYRVLVLLAAFASLRWAEVTALHRQDVDLDNATVRVRVAFTVVDAPECPACTTPLRVIGSGPTRREGRCGTRYPARYVT